MRTIMLEITDDAFKQIENYLGLKYICGGSIEGVDSEAMVRILKAMAIGSEKVTLSLKHKRRGKR